MSVRVALLVGLDLREPVKDNTVLIYLLLTDFGVRTVRYRPSFFLLLYGSSAKRAGHKSTGETRIRNLQYGQKKRAQ